MPLELALEHPDKLLASQAALAAQALSELAGQGKKKKGSSKKVVLEARDEARHVARAEIPIEIFRLFVRMLSEVAQGRAVALMPLGKELTTQQAAELLNVSRPHVIQLLENGLLPFRKVGTHRRVRFDDVLQFKAKDDARRKAIADELTREAEEAGLDY